MSCKHVNVVWICRGASERRGWHLPGAATHGVRHTLVAVVSGDGRRPQHERARVGVAEADDQHRAQAQQDARPSECKRHRQDGAAPAHTAPAEYLGHVAAQGGGGGTMYLPRMLRVSVATADASALFGLSCMQLSGNRPSGASFMLLCTILKQRLGLLAASPLALCWLAAQLVSGSNARC